MELIEIRINVIIFKFEIFKFYNFDYILRKIRGGRYRN